MAMFNLNNFHTIQEMFSVNSLADRAQCRSDTHLHSQFQTRRAPGMPRERLPDWMVLGDYAGDAFPPRKRRKGGKIYSGCTTCRRRKIKCDKRRPTCHNCEKSRQYICDGYKNEDFASSSVVGGPLVGTQNPNPHPSSDYTSSSTNPSPEHDFTDVDIFIRDQLVSSSSDRPGDVLTQAKNSTTAPLQVTTENPAQFLSYLQAVFPDGSLDFPMGPDIPETDSTLLWPQPTIVDDETQYTRSQGSTSGGLVSAEVSKQRSLSITSEGHGAPSIGKAINVATSPARDLVEFSTLPAATRELLHHYRTHVCQLMMPTAAPSHNPWLQLYLPRAIQDSKTPANQALLHSILAVSAFNLASLRGSDPGSYKSQALNHSGKAAQNMKAIEFSDSESALPRQDKSNKQAALAAALTMTTIEVFSGGNQGNCHRYLRTAKEIIERTGGIDWWLLDPQSTTLLQIFRCLRIVSDTAGWSEANYPSKTHESETPEAQAVVSTMSDARNDELIVMSPFSSYEYTLDVSFGISMRTLWCLNKIVELDGIKASAPKRSCWWDEHRTDLVKLDAEIFGRMEDPDAFTDYGSLLALPGQSTDAASSVEQSLCYSSVNCDIPQIVAQELRENHLWAFHYAVALFYRRAICGGGSNTSCPVGATHQSTPPPSGQFLVSKVLEHLENIDALTVGTPVANTLWPGFIAAVEAVDTDLRHRVLSWFARARRHGIGNIPAAKTVALEAWRRVDRQTYQSHDRKGLLYELGPVDWRTTMREKGMYIMLT